MVVLAIAFLTQRTGSDTLVLVNAAHLHMPLVVAVASRRFESSILALGVLLVMGALVSGLARRSFVSLTALFVVAGFLLGDEHLENLGLTDAQRGRIHVLSNVNEEVSATDLRRRLAAGEPCSDLLSGPVEDYIRQRGLYR